MRAQEKEGEESEMRVMMKPEERKEKILRDAIGVFLRKGYEKTCISDIAEAAGISQGLCYRYFASKEVLYEAAVVRFAEQMIADSRQEAFSMQSFSLQAERIRKRMEEIPAAEGGQRVKDELYIRIGRLLVPMVKECLHEEIVYDGSRPKEAARMASLLVSDELSAVFR